MWVSQLRNCSLCSVSMSGLTIPDNEILDSLVEKWSKVPSDIPKTKNNYYLRMMDILYGHEPDYIKWMSDPYKMKQMQMNLGNFIQELIGSLENHTNYGTGHISGLDGCNKNDSTGVYIEYEMKIDENTTNSASLEKSIEKLIESSKRTGSKPLLIQFFRTAKISEKNKYKRYLITGDEYLKLYAPEIGGIRGLISAIESRRSPLSLWINEPETIPVY